MRTTAVLPSFHDRSRGAVANTEALPPSPMALDAASLRLLGTRPVALNGHMASVSDRGVLIANDMTQKKEKAVILRSRPISSGGRIRTYDLRVMSPTSCLCSTLDLISGISGALAVVGRNADLPAREGWQ